MVTSMPYQCKMLIMGGGKGRGINGVFLCFLFSVTVNLKLFYGIRLMYIELRDRESGTSRGQDPRGSRVHRGLGPMRRGLRSPPACHFLSFLPLAPPSSLLGVERSWPEKPRWASWRARLSDCLPGQHQCRDGFGLGVG